MAKGAREGRGALGAAMGGRRRAAHTDGSEMGAGAGPGGAELPAARRQLPGGAERRGRRDSSPARCAQLAGKGLGRRGSPCRSEPFKHGAGRGGREMTASGGAGHGSDAALPSSLLGRNMHKAGAGGAEKASPENAERKNPGRSRAGGVSAVWSGAGGSPCPLRVRSVGWGRTAVPGSHRRGAVRRSRERAGFGAAGKRRVLPALRAAGAAVSEWPGPGTALLLCCPLSPLEAAGPSLVIVLRLNLAGMNLGYCVETRGSSAALNACCCAEKIRAAEALKPGTDKDVAAGSAVLQAGAGGEGSGPRTCWCGPVSVCVELRGEMGSCWSSRRQPAVELVLNVRNFSVWVSLPVFVKNPALLYVILKALLP